MMKSFFGIKESKKESVCPICGGKLIDDFCNACNKYSSSEIAHKKLKDKYPHIRCKCKSKKIEFSIEEPKVPIPKNFLDKTALDIIEKYNQKYPQDTPAYREIAKCKKCGNKWYVDGYRDDNKIMTTMRNSFLILIVIVFLALIITIGSISENKQTEFETDDITTSSQITQNDIEETTDEIITTDSIPTTDELNDNYGEIGSDIEIVTKANHPRYLDDIEIATNIWEYEIDENKVVVNGLDNSIHNRSHIIEIDITENDLEQKYISFIEIYFSRFDDIISFNDALNIVATYLPKETIQQYYMEDLSYSESRDSGNGTLYSKSYILKDDKYSDEHRLESYLEIMIWVDEDGNAEQARIDSYMLSEFDDETMDEWDYNFFSTNNEKPIITTTEKVTTTEATTKETTTVKSGRIVYITPYCEKYHCSASCAGSNAMERDYDDIEGVYDPCKKCAY